MAVSLDIPTPATIDLPGSDVTPTGYAAMTGQDLGKVVGSAGDDRATLFDIQKDSDQVIKMGLGNDVFVFGPNDTKIDLNGLVFMGDGGNDQVYLNHRIEDYIFTVRSEGGIKIEFVGEPDGGGDACTFYGAESFVFRNIDSSDVIAINYTNSVFSQADLYAAIVAATV